MRDDGIPPRNGSASLFVTILDANDNSPIFDPGVYAFAHYVHIVCM